jgi:type VI secretion system protein ImpH
MQRAPFKALIKDIALSQSLLDHLKVEPWRNGFFALMRGHGDDFRARALRAPA